MDQFVGLDVSQNLTYLCVVDSNGSIEWQGKCASTPEALAELLNGERFYTPKEAQVITEQWRHHYNDIRPHSSLGYKPSASLVRMKDGALVLTRLELPKK